MNIVKLVANAMEYKHTYPNTACYITFLDLKQAFDRVPHDKIINALKKYNLNSKALNLV